MSSLGESAKCVVCGDLAVGRLYRVVCCGSCASFFCIQETSGDLHKCIQGNGKCIMNKATRGFCTSCRYQKCLKVGMNRRPFPSNSTKPSSKGKCLVCGDISGVARNYGADSCSACANFFHRNYEKLHECIKGEGKCEVNNETRGWCKSCRLKKCLNVGMKPSRNEAKCLNEDQRTRPLAVQEESAEDQYKRMPIFEKMIMSYEELEELRNDLHRSNGGNISEERNPRSLKFQECLNQLSKQTHLLADWIECCFDEFHTLAVDQKALLFSNFLPVFTILERTYVTSKFGKKNQLLLSSGDFVEIDKLEDFFTDEEKGICGKQMAESFQSSVKQYETLQNLLSTEHVDLFEFFTLTVLSLWDHGLVGQSEECMSLSRKINMAIAEEYSYYQTHYKKNPTKEMVMNVSVLTCLQRVSNRLREDMSLAHLFDVYTIPENVINTFVGRYS